VLKQAGDWRLTAKTGLYRTKVDDGNRPKAVFQATNDVDPLNATLAVQRRPRGTFPPVERVRKRMIELAVAPLAQLMQLAYCLCG
jgi:hypothetical protein